MSDRYDIRVELVDPPCPANNGHATWFAHDDQRYDVDCDDGVYVGNDAGATGSTKWDAIRQLIDQLEENDEV